MISNCMYGAAHPGDAVAVRGKVGNTVGWLCPAHYKQHERALANNGYHFRTSEELMARGEFNGGQSTGGGSQAGMDQGRDPEQQQLEYGDTGGNTKGLKPTSERNTYRDTGGSAHGSAETGRLAHDRRELATGDTNAEKKELEAVSPREAAGQRGLPSGAAKSQELIAPEWPKWLEGAGHLQLTEVQIEILQQPFSDSEITIRYDGVVYAPWRRYWSRMVRAFAPFVPSVIPVDNPRFQGTEIVVGVVMVCQGTFIGKAWGSHRLEGENDRMSMGDRIESAISDAIAKIGKRLNMGEQLWDDEFRDYWKSQYAESYSNGKRTYWRKRPGAQVEEHEC